MTSRILLVENCLVQARVVRKWLNDSIPYADIAVAFTGTDTFSLLQEFHPEIVILDLALPDVNGLEICRKIKNSLTTRHINVIVFSNENQLPTFTAAFEVGADYCITTNTDNGKNLCSLVMSIIKRNSTAPQVATPSLSSITMMQVS